MNRRDLLGFPFDPEHIDPKFKSQIVDLGMRYLQELRKTSRIMLKSGLQIETFDYVACKRIVDDIDVLLAQHYGLTNDELDYIINYDIKYRIGTAGGEK